MTIAADPPTSINHRRRALIALALLLPAPTLGPALMLLWMEGALGTALEFACKAWVAVLPLAWHLKVDRRPIRIEKPTLASLAVGGATGLVILAGMLTAYWLARPYIDLGPLRAKAHETGFDSPVLFLGMLSFIIVLNALMEEYVWRWFAFSKVREALPSGGRGAGIAAVVITAALFTVHHVVALSAWVSPPINALASTGVFLGGMIWSALYLRYGTIWPGYASHIFADVAILIMGWDLLFSQAA